MDLKEVVNNAMDGLPYEAIKFTGSADQYITCMPYNTVKQYASGRPIMITEYGYLDIFSLAEDYSPLVDEVIDRAERAGLEPKKRVETWEDEVGKYHIGFDIALAVEV